MDPDATYQALDVFEGEGDDEQWYWHVTSGNGKIVATGGEGYSSKAAAYRGYASAAKVIVGLAAATVKTQAENEADRIEKEAAQAEPEPGAGA
jgi:uncharacterized protein YegP (UPF0339 family)